MRRSSRSCATSWRLTTAQVTFGILNDLTVRDGARYQVSFADSFLSGTRRLAGKNYTVLDLVPITEAVTFFDTNYSSLMHQNIVDDATLEVRSVDNTLLYVAGNDYVINPTRGSIRRTARPTTSGGCAGR